MPRARVIIDATFELADLEEYPDHVKTLDDAAHYEMSLVSVASGEEIEISWTFAVEEITK